MRHESRDDDIERKDMVKTKLGYTQPTSSILTCDLLNVNEELIVVRTEHQNIHSHCLTTYRRGFSWCLPALDPDSFQSVCVHHHRQLSLSNCWVLALDRTSWISFILEADSCSCLLISHPVGKLRPWNPVSLPSALSFCGNEVIISRSLSKSLCSSLKPLYPSSAKPLLVCSSQLRRCLFGSFLWLYNCAFGCAQNTKYFQYD